MKTLRRINWVRFIQKNLIKLFPILLILLVGLFPISWFKDGLGISFFDEEIPIPPFYSFETYLSAWYGRSAPGFYSGRVLAKLLFVSYFVLLNKAGIPIPVLQASYIAGFTLLAGFSIYYLFRGLFKDHFNRAGALIAAMLYMNNPVLYHIIWRYMLISLYPTYAITPLIVIIYLKSLQSGNFLRYSATTALLLLFASPLGESLPYSTPLVIIVCSCIIFSIVLSDSWKDRLGRSLKFWAATGVLSLLLQSWWFVTFSMNLQSSMNTLESFRSAVGSSSIDTLLINSKTTSLVNLFQMQGHAASYLMDVGEVPWSSYDPIYLEKPLWIALGFIPPFLVVLGILYTKTSKWRNYFAGLWIFSLVALGGAHPPFGKIYLRLWEIFPFMAAYRNYYDKFGLLLPFTSSVLAGLGATLVLSSLSKSIKKKNKLLSRTFVVSSTALLIVALCIWSYPFWTGDIIPHPNSVRAGAYFQVPAYYSEADQWLQQQGQNFRMMVLPLPKLYYGAFNWANGFWGSDPSTWLFSTPSIVRITSSQSYALPVRIAELINSGKPTNVACLLGLLNAKYVMLHGDTSWNYVRYSAWWVTQPDISEAQTREFLSKQPDLQFASTIGQLHFYENTKLLPHTYAAQQFIFLDGEIEALVDHYTMCDTNFPPAIFLSKLDSGLTPTRQELEKIARNNETPPTITDTKLSANYYTIHVENARSPFILVFGESYDPDWSAKISNQIVPSHFLINGYANAWYIDQTGSFDISISFKKQRLVELGFILSILGIFSTITVLIIGLRQKT